MLKTMWDDLRGKLIRALLYFVVGVTVIRVVVGLLTPLLPVLGVLLILGFVLTFIIRSPRAKQ